MRAIWRLTLGIFALFLFVFIASLVLDIPIDRTVSNWLGLGGLPGMLLSVLLLIADVFLPIPSSLIMLINGALYGAVLGSMVSLAGGLGAALVGYYLGRGGETLAHRWIGAEELELGRKFFKRWGILAVAISRPIPLLAETVMVMAGLSGWSLRRSLFSAFLGLVPVVVIYAVCGAFAYEQDYGLLTLLMVVVVSGIGWLLSKRYTPEDKESAYTEN